LSAAASAQLVSAWLRLLVDNGLWGALRCSSRGRLRLPRRSRSVSVGRISVMVLRLLEPASALQALLVLAPNFDPEDELGDIVSEALDHLRKHLVTFLLVGYLRVYLSVAPEADPGAKLVHRVKVVLPLFIDLEEQDELLDPLH